MMVVIVNHIHDNSYASAVALPDIMLKLIPAASAVFLGKVMGCTIAPGCPAFKLRDWQEFHSIDSKIDQVIQQLYSILKSAGPVFTKTKSPHMEFIYDHVLNPCRQRPARGKLILPEFLFRNKLMLWPDIFIKIFCH